MPILISRISTNQCWRPMQAFVAFQLSPYSLFPVPQYDYAPIPFVRILVASRVWYKSIAMSDEASWENTYKDPTGGIVTVKSELGEPIHKIANRSTFVFCLDHFGSGGSWRSYPQKQGKNWCSGLRPRHYLQECPRHASYSSVDRRSWREGSHHSFEDFHQPMLAGIRRVPNIIIVVGSGFGDAEGTVPYLTGECPT
ncbi:hypothetical protein BCR33DRAFT_799499 [Rhizoclosmatium globosum]|uniref:Fatty acid synthase beta subunit AflB /Fas1-like central domain-containing protein n=1 Tax=Rhizoclosmatium globosum TaxID=329046 RepID=A0A1Y2A6F0_9FUNG|nr:hypothetical protein BCR33DRAFT_799499 [Rhizoclosmatium globosum]|eukprot:ORY17900.1 hypothetical protein BCR33DRAFT_799499 [Rhizoclosmatium globosum]